MANTDGYLTDDPNGPWLRANTGTGQGTLGFPEASPVYARFEHPEAPLAGARVDGEGNISEGPKIQFVEAGALLDQAPAEDAARPFVVWAGVSPMSLSEALVVWNTEIVLLNKGKIGGGDVVSVTGRLMIINMGSPIAINGLEQRTLTFEPGAIGFYKGDGAPDACQDNPVRQTQGPALGGVLADPGTPPDPCACTQVFTGAGGGGGGGVAGANVDALLFSTICNPTAQCGEFDGNTAQFIVNNGLNVPVRCSHPFYLALLKTGFGCGCGPPCERNAEVWEASMELYGATLPGEIFPLDRLVSINPCAIGDHNFSNGYAGSLIEDVSCASIPPCPPATVSIVGRFGQAVTKTGVWNHPNPGYEGQAVLYKPECETICGVNCQAEVDPDQADCFVPEDIIKPIQRTVPVSFFDSWLVTTTQITVPSTCFTSAVTLMTSCETQVIQFVTDLATDVIQVPVGDGALVSTFNTQAIELPTAILTTANNFLTDVDFFNLPFVDPTQAVGADFVLNVDFDSAVVGTSFGVANTVTLPVGDGALVTNVGTAVITVCDNTVTEVLTVVTDIATVPAGTTVVDLVTAVGTETINFVLDVSTGGLAFNAVDVVTNASSDFVTLVTGLATDLVTIVEDLQTITASVSNVTIPTAFPTTEATVVTACLSKEETQWVFEECIEHDIIVETDIDGIELLTSTDSPGCAVPFKFLNHDGPIPYTQRATKTADCCVSSAECTTTIVDHPVEANCEQFLLLRANYVDAPAPPTRDTCPCYDCTSEDCEDAGGGPYESPGVGGPEPCTINVRRLNRRWCIGNPCRE